MARGKRGKGAAANDDTDFDQGGPDGAARQRKAANGADTTDDGDSPGMGHNRVYDGEYIRGAIEQILAEDASIKAVMDAAKLKTQPQRKKKADIIRGLQKSGVGMREVQTLLKKARLELKLETVTSELDDGQKHEFERILAAMGDFADSPLGAAALAAAEADTAKSAAEPVH